MTSILSYQRRPLATRTLPNSPGKATRGTKRARSPERGGPSIQAAKRARLAPVPAPVKDPQKEKKTEREQKESEFREKYTRAFPSWKFYFDTEKPLSVNESSLRSRVLALGAAIVDFFDKTVTHVISDAETQSISTEPIPDKENYQHNKPLSRRGVTALRSPIKLADRAKEEKKNVAIQQAIISSMKIWNAVKLDSVLSRCLNVPTSQQASTSQKPTLSKLLQDEKIHGTTERDPNQKRHNYHYFTLGSCFVLVEDISEELATVAAHEYPAFKDKGPNSKKPWPVLHCHPHSRNPFAPFDEKEKKRWAKQQQAEKDEEKQRDQRRKQRELEALKRRAQSKIKGDLRRSVSFNNIRRRYTMDNCVDLDSGGDEAAEMSGYLASGAGAGYVAASGNSVGITSTTGTTSSAAQVLRKIKLPAAIDARIKSQVVTSLKVSAKEKVGNAGDTGLMGPPEVPKPRGMIKRSKSTNTMKLPKREEGAKPGYCESCRMKFSDFNEHVESKKHAKFASNPTNFEALDFVLEKLRRRSRDEVEAEERQRIAKLKTRWAAIRLRSSFDDIPGLLSP